jgi:hypothetical protein
MSSQLSALPRLQPADSAILRISATLSSPRRLIPAKRKSAPRTVMRSNGACTGRCVPCIPRPAGTATVGQVPAARAATSMMASQSAAMSSSWAHARYHSIMVNSGS